MTDDDYLKSLEQRIARLENVVFDRRSELNVDLPPWRQSLRKSLGTYQQHLPEMLRDHPEEFVAIKDGVILGYNKDPNVLKSLYSGEPGKPIWITSVRKLSENTNG